MPESKDRTYVKCSPANGCAVPESPLTRAELKGFGLTCHPSGNLLRDESVVGRWETTNQVSK
ncbi:hypothetical protein [Tsukamurella soli]|uniref:Uncharacterized protein n=1 Tax=Tsukamurella soli TaxID=644556 RepID=A0ABP8JJD6_9ACTN